jgi:hypothetical protein
LGKFGKFQSNDIINKPYGYSYRIEKGRAYVTKKDTDLSEVGNIDIMLIHIFILIFK